MDLRGQMRDEVGRYFDLTGMRLTPEELQLLYDYVTELSTFTQRELHTVTVTCGKDGAEHKQWNTYRFAPDGTVVHSGYYQIGGGRQGNVDARITGARDVIAVLNQIGEEGATFQRAKMTPRPLRLITAKAPAKASVQEPEPETAEPETVSRGEQIRAMRTRLGMTKTMLAQRLGCSLSAIQMWETDKVQIGADYWAKISELMGEEPPKPVDIAMIRSRMKLTQAELAERLGCRPGSVQAWETGRTKPSREFETVLRELEAEAATIPPEEEPEEETGYSPAAIRTARETLGLTRKALGERISCSASLIQGWESGKVPVSDRYGAALEQLMADAQEAARQQAIQAELDAQAARMREIMKARKINQKGLAELLGATQSQVSSWLLGKVKMRRVQMEKLEAFLPKQITVDDLLAALESQDAPEALNKECQQEENSEQEFQSSTED